MAALRRVSVPFPKYGIHPPDEAECHLNRMEQSTRELPTSQYFNQFLQEVMKRPKVKGVWQTGRAVLSVGPEFHCGRSKGAADLAVSVSCYGWNQKRDPFPAWIHESKAQFLRRSVKVVSNPGARRRAGNQLRKRLLDRRVYEELKRYEWKILPGSSCAGVHYCQWEYDVDASRVFWVYADEGLIHFEPVRKGVYPEKYWRLTVEDYDFPFVVAYAHAKLMEDLQRLDRRSLRAINKYNVFNQGKSGTLVAAQESAAEDSDYDPRA